MRCASAREGSKSSWPDYGMKRFFAPGPGAETGADMKGCTLAVSWCMVYQHTTEARPNRSRDTVIHPNRDD
jgi:hypothetical protein